MPQPWHSGNARSLGASQRRECGRARLTSMGRQPGSFLNGWHHRLILRETEQELDWQLWEFTACLWAEIWGNNLPGLTIAGTQHALWRRRILHRSWSLLQTWELAET